MVDQFEQFQALYRQSCAMVPAGQCGQPYSVSGLYLVPALLALGLLLYWLSGLSGRVAHVAEARTQRMWLQAIVVAAPLWALWTALLIGLQWWQLAQVETQCVAQVIDRAGVRHCLGDQSVFGELWHTAVTQFRWLPYVMLLCFCAALAMERWPKRLWLVTAVAWFSYVGVTVAFPSTDIRPLPEGAVADAVHALVRAQGMNPSRVGVSRNIVADSGEWGRVEGLFDRQSIVFGAAHFDDGYPPNVIHDGFFVLPYGIGAMRAVTGHELAHVRQNHIGWNLLVTAMVALLLCWSADRGLRRLWQPKVSASAVPRWRRWAILPLIGVAGCVAIIASDAALRCFRLWGEYQADQLGLDIARDPDGFAEVALLLAAGSRFELTWSERWLTQHPSPADRIRMVIAWQQRHRPERSLMLPDLRKLLVPAQPAIAQDASSNRRR